LPGRVRGRPQRVTSAGSGGRRDTLRPGAAVTVSAAATMLLPPPVQLRLLLLLLYSQFGD